MTASASALFIAVFLACSVEAVEVGTVHEGLIYYARGYHRIAYQG